MRLVEQAPREDGVRVLAGQGELDVTTVPAILPGVPALVDGARAVVLDLSGLDFFDSAGVRLVDQLARGCAGRSVPWRVVAPRDSVARRILALVDMVGPEVVEDRGSALASLRRD